MNPAAEILLMNLKILFQYLIAKKFYVILNPNHITKFYSIDVKLEEINIIIRVDSKLESSVHFIAFCIILH